jgi:ribosomal protein L15E
MKNFSDRRQECGWICRQRTESMNYRGRHSIGNRQRFLRPNVQALRFFFSDNLIKIVEDVYK